MELSRRQSQIAAYVAKGVPDKRIAEKLHISVFTVRRHIQEATRDLPGDTSRRNRLLLFFLNINSAD